MTVEEIAPWETPEPVSELIDEPTPKQWADAFRDVVLNMHADHATVQ